VYNATVNDKYSLNVQLNYTGVETAENVLTFGFLRYSNSFKTVPFELEGGKFRYEHGLYGGELTNPRLRPNILPPQSIYYTPLKYNLTSAYGLKANAYFGDLEVSASVGQAVSNNDQQEFFVWLNHPSSKVAFNEEQKKIDPQFGGLYSFFIKHRTEHNLFKASYTDVQLNDLIHVQMIMVGDEITYDKLSLSAETMLISPVYHGGPKTTFLDWDKAVNKGYSLTASYRVLDTVKVSVNYNTYLLSELSLASARRGVDNNRDSFSDLNAGVVWNVTDNLMLRGELHYMQGSRLLPGRESYNSNSYDSYYVGNAGFAYFFD
jgi:hypothetical protein